MAHDRASQARDTGVNQDVALEDWDALFDAVVGRLRLNVEQWNAVVPSGRRDTWGQVRTNILECVAALDQLHLTATHAFEHHHRVAIEALVLRPIAPLLPQDRPPPTAFRARPLNADAVATALPVQPA